MDFPQLEQQSGNIPVPRFGHTTTYVGNNKVVLFGGAYGAPGQYLISSETYLCDLLTFRWVKLNTEKPPQARAAHAAACVDSMQLVIYGGANGGGSLSSDELYVLDLRKEPHYVWMTVHTTSPSPGRRYGHSMIYFRPNLIVFGGNDGQQTINDAWFMNIENTPFNWYQVRIANHIKVPPSRVYHGCEVCREGPASGMMVIFGGRSSTGKSLKDTWGLRQHRDGQWDWVEAPVRQRPNKKTHTPSTHTQISTQSNALSPIARLQHSCVFVGPKFVVLGGRTEVDSNNELPTEIYDTEAIEWRQLPSLGRVRHSCWVVKNTIFIFGGFSIHAQNHPTSELLSINCAAYVQFFNEKETIERNRALQISQQNSFLTTITHSNLTNLPPPTQTTNETTPNTNTANNTTNTNNTQTHTQTNEQPANRWLKQLNPTNTNNTQTTHTVEFNSNNNQTQPRMAAYVKAQTGDIRLTTHAHAVHDDTVDFSSIVRRISIDKLEEEGKKINKKAVHNINLITHKTTKTSFYDDIIRTLLTTNLTYSEMHTIFNPEGPFSLTTKEIIRLCEDVLKIFKEEEMVLSLRTPIKIFGDIHGQFYDLMRLFGSYKCPLDEDFAEELEVDGDIDSNDYLFLGDFVDRGSNSLEVICLLFALKCKYPKQIHMIRGNHEDIEVNSFYGFQDECRRRLREDCSTHTSCWSLFNQIFEWLPLSAIIENKIFCIHAGIGGYVRTPKDISNIQRPLKVAQIPTNTYEQCITDALWSDPTDNDSMLGIYPNDVRDPDGVGHVVKFGPDVVHQFLSLNNLQLIIRAHECVMDGFERFADGKLITLFSATNYCDHHNNAGALLFVRRDMTILPKIIFPFTSEARPIKTWDTRITELRPPTPPRQAPLIKESDLGI